MGLGRTLGGRGFKRGELMILELASAEGRVVVSENTDFRALLAQSGAIVVFSRGRIRIRPLPVRPDE